MENADKKLEDAIQKMNYKLKVSFLLTSYKVFFCVADCNYCALKY